MKTFDRFLLIGGGVLIGEAAMLVAIKQYWKALSLVFVAALDIWWAWRAKP